MDIRLKIQDSYTATFLALIGKLKYVKVEEMIESKEKKEVDISILEPNDFQKFLLTAPVMSDEEYQFYLEKRQDFNKWKQLS